MVQIRNHHPKSEVLIQSETALNAGERGSFDGSIGSKTQREHKDALYFWVPEQVQDKDFSIKKELNCANIGRMPIIASVLLCCSNGKMGVLQMGSHTPLQDEGRSFYGGSGLKDLQTRYKYRDPRYVTPVQKQKQTVVNVDREHRDGFRQSEAETLEVGRRVFFRV